MEPTTESQTSEPQETRRRRFPRLSITRALAWVIPAILVAGVTVVAIEISAPERGHGEIGRLTPLEPGTTWVFATTTGGKPTGLEVSQVTGSSLMLVNGKTTTAVAVETYYENFLGSGNPLRVIGYQGFGADQLLDYGHRFGGEFHATDPPQPVLQAPLREGRHWSWRGETFGQKTRSTTTVLGVGEVTAGERSFSDCVHLLTRSTSKDESGGTSRERVEAWSCPGVGLVKLDDRSSEGPRYQTELVEAHGPGIDMEARSGGLEPLAPAAGSPQPGATLGVDGGRSGYVPRAELRTDRFAWTIVRRENILYPPVGEAGLAVLAEDDGTISATDVRTGEVRWEVQLKGPAVAPPVMAGPLVLAADANRALFALDAKTGWTRWEVDLSDQLASPPVVVGETVLAVDEDRSVRAVRLGDGKELWRSSIQDLATTAPALAGDVVVIADQAGGLTAFSVEDGSSPWTTTLDQVLETGPVAAEGVVLATDASNHVQAFDAEDGKPLWNVTPGAFTSVAPAVAQGRVVLGNGRSLETRDLRTGELIWRTAMHGELDASPIVLGDTIVVAYQNDRLERFSLEEGRSLGLIAVPGPDTKSDRFTDLPFSYVDGALVVPQHNQGPWPFTWLLAYPAPRPGDDVGTEGVRLAGDIRMVPTQPVYPPRIVGNDIFFAGLDQTAWRVPANGPPQPLTKGGGSFIPFAVPAGDVVLVQVGDKLEAIPANGGKAEWTFPMQAAVFQGAPAVVGETVVVPETGVGLAGVDAATGNQKWFRRMPGTGVSAPLVLPGGDVAYAVGGLSVLDAETGSLRWRIPDVNAVGPVASEDGEVYAVAFTATGSVLGAVDARTGRVLWQVPFNPTLFLGPAAGEGAVVAGDPQGNVSAYDGGNGNLLWSLPLRSPLASSPLIVDGKVVLWEGGRTEDLNQRDNRITILDPRTGRFLGSFEFTGLATVVGGMGAEGNTLIVPATTSGISLLLLRMEGP